MCFFIVYKICWSDFWSRVKLNYLCRKSSNLLWFWTQNWYMYKSFVCANHVMLRHFEATQPALFISKRFSLEDSLIKSFLETFVVFMQRWIWCRKDGINEIYAEFLITPEFLNTSIRRKGQCFERGRCDTQKQVWIWLKVKRIKSAEKCSTAVEVQALIYWGNLKE